MNYLPRLSQNNYYIPILQLNNIDEHRANHIGVTPCEKSQGSTIFDRLTLTPIGGTLRQKTSIFAHAPRVYTDA